MGGKKFCIPKRRFKEFQNADAWEQRKLDEICKINGRIGFRGYTEKDIITKESGGVLTYSPTNIVNNQLSTNCKNTYITRDKYEESPEIMISNGDILFVKTGSTLGKSALVKGLSEDATLNPQVIVMRVKKETETFVSAMLTTDRVLKQIASAKIGGAVPTLTETQIKLINIYEPVSDLEKVKIGTFFTNLDNLITLHQRKLEKMKSMKAAYLTEMFPQEGEVVPKRRFSGFTDAWEQRKVGDIAEIVRGASPRPIQDPKWFDNENSEIGWLRISDVTEQNGRIHFLEQKISKEGQEKTRVLLEPHLLLSIAATVGKPVINYVKTGVHDGFLIFLNPQFDKEYMFQWLEMFRPQWQQFGQPGSQVNLNSEIVRNAEIFMPTFKEQQKIGNFFTNLDNLITLHQRKLDKLQNIKKAYLNEMFI